MQVLFNTADSMIAREQYNNPALLAEYSRPKKVLFVIDTLETGGAEQSLYENVSRFKTLDAVVCHIYRGDTLKSKFTSRGIIVHSIGLDKKYGFIDAYRKLKAVVKKEKPDLIVAYLTRSEIISRILGRVNHIPVVGTFVSDLYDKSYNTSLSLKGKLGVSFFKNINKYTTGLCKGFIANSQTVKISNAKHLGVPLEKIEVINRGRDSKTFVFNSPAMFSSSTIRFLNVGRLVEVKGHEDLILAFKRFLVKCPNAILHIIGSGPTEKSLTRLIHMHHLEDSVKLLGTKTDIMRRLHSYDCFIFPSKSEGFSGALLEAMFAGLPVLASDIAANQELVQHMKTGYLFKTGSIENITNAMIWFSNNRYTAYSNAFHAHDHAVKNFDQENQAEKFENHLYQLIAGKL